MSQELPRDTMAEKIIGSETLYRGSFLSVEHLQVELPNGNRSTRDVVRHPGAVGIVALTEDGRIVLVHQYRTALERVTVEIPAGKLSPGEDAEECARRELSEETGVQAGTMRYLTAIATSVGFSDEILHLFLATDLTFNAAHPDEDEFVSIELMAIDDLINLVLDGKIEDSKTIIGALICDSLSHRMSIL